MITFDTKRTGNPLDVMMSDGVWLVADTKCKKGLIVVWVEGGKISPMVREDRELLHDRFFPTAKFLGPFNPEDVLGRPADRMLLSTDENHRI